MHKVNRRFGGHFYPTIQCERPFPNKKHDYVITINIDKESDLGDIQDDGCCKFSCLDSMAEHPNHARRLAELGAALRSAAEQVRNLRL